MKSDVYFTNFRTTLTENLLQKIQRLIKKAGIEKRVIAVSRFSDPIALEYLHANEIETIDCDLLNKASLNALPDVENVIFMAGRKFHQCDDNFLRDAEKLLTGEIAISMGMTHDEARTYLREKLK